MICVRYERISEFATMAQVVERILGKDEVGGSSPPSSSKKPLLQCKRGFFNNIRIMQNKERFKTVPCYLVKSGGVVIKCISAEVIQ